MVKSRLRRWVRLASGKDEEIQLVVFALAGEEYGVPVGQVQEIIRMAAITHLPKTSEYVEGVINLRGRVIPIVDLKRLFNLAATARDDRSRIMVVEVERQVVGLTVDTVSEVLRLPASAIDPPPRVAGVDSGYLTGVGKLEGRLLMLLDLGRLVPQLALEGLELAAGA